MFQWFVGFELWKAKHMHSFPFFISCHWLEETRMTFWFGKYWHCIWACAFSLFCARLRAPTAGSGFAPKQEFTVIYHSHDCSSQRIAAQNHRITLAPRPVQYAFRSNCRKRPRIGVVEYHQYNPISSSLVAAHQLFIQQ